MELPNQTAVDSGGSFTPVWIAFFQRVLSVVNAGQQSGATADRPTTGLWIGRRYYDETLSKPVYVRSVRPTVWKDAMGTTV